MARRYSKISGMTLVACDARACTHEEFRSASVPKLIDEQLGIAGWTILQVGPGGLPMIGRVLPSSVARTVYLCPAHKPQGRMSGGPPPISTAGRTSH